MKLYVSSITHEEGDKWNAVLLSSRHGEQVSGTHGGRATAEVRIESDLPFDFAVSDSFELPIPTHPPETWR